VQGGAKRAQDATPGGAVEGVAEGSTFDVFEDRGVKPAEDDPLQVRTGFSWTDKCWWQLTKMEMRGVCATSCSLARTMEPSACKWLSFPEKRFEKSEWRAKSAVVN
jgi:hypothetical protein